MTAGGGKLVEFRAVFTPCYEKYYLYDLLTARRRHHPRGKNLRNPSDESLRLQRSLWVAMRLEPRRAAFERPFFDHTSPSMPTTSVPIGGRQPFRASYLWRCRRFGVGVGVGVGVMLGEGVAVGLGVGAGVIVGVGLGVEIGVGMGVGVGVGVALGVGVGEAACTVTTTAS